MEVLMSYDWGPRYIVPSEILKNYSGGVLLREEIDAALLPKDLEELGSRSTRCQGEQFLVLS